jgi:hypothetical protein
MTLRPLIALFGLIALTSCGSVEEPTVHSKLAWIAVLGSMKVGEPALLYANPVDPKDTGAVRVEVRITGNRPTSSVLHQRWVGLPDEQLAAVINDGVCCGHGLAFVVLKEPGTPDVPGPQQVSDSTFAAVKAWLSSRMTIKSEDRDWPQFEVHMVATPQLVHDIRALPTVRFFSPEQIDPFVDPARSADNAPLLAVIFTDAAHAVHAVAGDTLTVVYTQPDGSALTRSRIFF